MQESGALNGSGQLHDAFAFFCLNTLLEVSVVLLWLGCSNCHGIFFFFQVVPYS